MSLKVDLKSQEARRGVPFDYGWIFVFVFLAAAFVVYYMAGLRLESVVTQRQLDLQTWNDKVAGFSGIQDKLETLKSQISGIQAQITHLRELRFDPLRYSILLTRLSRLLPSNLWIGSLSIDPSQSQLTLAGSSVYRGGHPPLASLAEFLRNLQNDKNNYFSDIVLQSASASGKTARLWTFNLTARYSVPLIQSSPPPPTAGTLAPLPTAAPSQAPASAPSAPPKAPATAVPPPRSPRVFVPRRPKGKRP